MTALTGTDDGEVGYAVQGTDSASPTQTAPDGTQDFAGVSGQSTNWFGVRAASVSGIGVSGASASNTGVQGKNGNGSGIGGDVAGVSGDSDNGCGVEGLSWTADGVRGINNGNGAAIRGICQSANGLAGKFDGNVYVIGDLLAGGGLTGMNNAGSGITIAFGGGVRGDSDNGWGVIGTSWTYDGVRGENNGNGAAIHGVCHSTGGNAGLFDGNVVVNGNLLAGGGLTGMNNAGSGITIAYGGGVRGDSDNGWGVIGTSWTYDGVRGENNGNGAAIHGVCHSTGGNAGLFDGNVVVNGNLSVPNATVEAANATFTNNVVVGGVLQVTSDIILLGADCAEEFDLNAGVGAEPGSVMVIDPATGTLMPCCRPYDTCAAGVVSGAGEFRAALTLDRRPDIGTPRGAIALVGKAYCRATATSGPIAIGDLLTTSSTPGHAMKVADSSRAVGAIIGKALGTLESGTGLVPMLIALQ